MAACLEMYNQNNNPPLPPPPLISPRISFSNDFLESNSSTSSHSHHQLLRSNNNYRDAPISSDFEFSVTNYSMMSADELFSHGRLLPLKENFQKTTLREELLAGEDNDVDGFSLRPPKSSSARWKGFLGLKKAHIGSRNIDKSQGSAKSSSQEVKHDGGSGSKNVEFRF